MKFLEPPLAIQKTERTLGSRMGYDHGTRRPESQVSLCKPKLGPPIVIGQAKKLGFLLSCSKTS